MPAHLLVPERPHCRRLAGKRRPQPHNVKNNNWVDVGSWFGLTSIPVGLAWFLVGLTCVRVGSTWIPVRLTVGSCLVGVVFVRLTCAFVWLAWVLVGLTWVHVWHGYLFNHVLIRRFVSFSGDSKCFFFWRFKIIASVLFSGGGAFVARET